MHREVTLGHALRHALDLPHRHGDGMGDAAPENDDQPDCEEADQHYDGRSCDFHVSGFLGILDRLLLGGVDDIVGQAERGVLLGQVALLEERVGLVDVARAYLVDHLVAHGQEALACHGELVEPVQARFEVRHDGVVLGFALDGQLLDVGDQLLPFQGILRDEALLEVDRYLLDGVAQRYGALGHLIGLLVECGGHCRVLVDTEDRHADGDREQRDDGDV